MVCLRVGITNQKRLFFVGSDGSCQGIIINLYRYQNRKVHKNHICVDRYRQIESAGATGFIGQDDLDMLQHGVVTDAVGAKLEAFGNVELVPVSVRIG